MIDEVYLNCKYITGEGWCKSCRVDGNDYIKQIKDYLDLFISAQHDMTLIENE